MADPCFPTKSMLKRNGKPPKFDGLNEIADNLKDVGVESDLIGLWENKANVKLMTVLIMIIVPNKEQMVLMINTVELPHHKI